MGGTLEVMWVMLGLDWPASVPGQLELLEQQLATCCPPGMAGPEQRRWPHGSCVSQGGGLDAAVAVGLVVHVLHRDPPPNADHKGFNLALVFAASDAEVAVLAPALPPGVGSDLTT